MVIGAEGHAVDSGCVSGIFADIFACEDIGEDDVFIASPRNELGIVFVDVQGVDIVVVNVLVLLYHQSFRWVVKTDTAIL